MRSIKDVDFTGQRVLIRTDFNVEVKDGVPQDFYKIEAAYDTIRYVLSFVGAKVALLSHRGRPGGAKDPAFTMSVLADDLAQLFGERVCFICESHGVCVQSALDDDRARILLLENSRFEEGEEQNDRNLAKKIAAPFDLYINEAFAVSHRAHASVEAITSFLDAYRGLWLSKEIEMLTRVKENLDQPSVAIVGGSKIETKLPLITLFSEIYDNVLVGGRTAVEAQEQSRAFPDNVILPVDYTGGTRDIGPETVMTFVDHIKKAKTIVWNGPVGKFEEHPYDHGTLAIAEAIAANKNCFSVVGGGESVQALGDAGVFGDVSFVSTGGGAMLSFLLSEQMPGLDVI